MSSGVPSSAWNSVSFVRKKQKKIAFCVSFTNGSIKKSAYVIPLSEMKSSIHVLQKGDLLAKRWRVALSRSV